MKHLTMYQGTAEAVIIIRSSSATLMEMKGWYQEEIMEMLPHPLKTLRVLSSPP
jgi:hypothetical protein